MSSLVLPVLLALRAWGQFGDFKKMGFRFCLAFGARQTVAPQAFLALILALVSSQNMATAPASVSDS